MRPFPAMPRHSWCEMTGVSARARPALAADGGAGLRARARAAARAAGEEALPGGAHLVLAVGEADRAAMEGPHEGMAHEHVLVEALDGLRREAALEVLDLEHGTLGIVGLDAALDVEMAAALRLRPQTRLPPEDRA